MYESVRMYLCVWGAVVAGACGASSQYAVALGSPHLVGVWGRNKQKEGVPHYYDNTASTST